MTRCPRFDDLAAGERQGRKHVPVEVVVDVEVAGEPGAGVLGLIPLCRRADVR